MSDMYFCDGCCQCMNGKDGPLTLTNFRAEITHELIYHDGPRSNTMLRIAGRLHDPEAEEGKEELGVPLPDIEIPAADFAGMGWVAEKWGMKPIIFPTPGGERNLRTAIQVASNPERQDIYTHTGWTMIDGKPHYLTGSGGVHAKGLNSRLTVALPPELSRYRLPKPANDRHAFAASMALAAIGPGRTMVPLILGAYRAAIGPVDFAIHLAGRTGTFKSEISSLIQSHFGEGMDARHLPASWSSTPNALEHLAYRACNAVMVIDDFVPLGTTWQVRQLQKTADQIIRAQGNQAGRSRLTEMSQMQTTYYPRGLVLSTGEDVPEGHSIRARMLIIETAPGDIQPKDLTPAQAARARYPQAMADWICWLAEQQPQGELKSTARTIRDQNIGVGHSRTPPIVGDLIATAELLGRYAVERKYVKQETASRMVMDFADAVLEVAAEQDTYLHAADPINCLLECIHTMLSTQQAHIMTRQGGIPEQAERYGWTVQHVPGQMDNYRANGPRIGWIDHEQGELLLDPNTLEMLKKHSGGKLAVTNQTLMKRIKEAGILTRTDEARQRNTVRVTCDGHPRQVLSINLKELNDQELQ